MLLWQVSTGQRIHAEGEGHTSPIRDMVVYHNPTNFKPEERLLISASSTTLLVQKYIFTADSKKGIKPPVRHIKLMKKVQKDHDYFQRLYIAGGYLYCALQASPWLIRFKQDMLANSATQGKNVTVEVSGIKKSTFSAFLVVEDTLVIAASLNSVYLIENLDILNPPEEIGMPSSSEIASVCQASCNNAEDNYEWYAFLVAMKNGVVHLLLLSKERSKYQPLNFFVQCLFISFYDK